MRHVASAAAGGVIVAGLILLLQDAPAAPAGDSAALPDRSTELLDRLDAFDRRLRKLEDLGPRVQPAMLGETEPSASRVPLEASIPREVLVLMQDLQRQLAELRGRVMPLAAASGDDADPAAARERIDAVLARLHLHLQDRQAIQLLAGVQRIPLLVQFLERWPEDQMAKDRLTQLAADLSLTGRHDEALEAIDRYGARAGYAGWELDSMRLSYAASGDSRKIDIAMRLERSAPRLVDRAWARCTLASTLAWLGRRNEAIAAIDSMPSEYGNAKEAEHFVRDLQQLRKDILAGKR